MTATEDKAGQLLGLLFALGQQNIESFTASSTVAPSTPDVASISLITLTGNAAITIPAPLAAGQKKVLYLEQDATGSRVPTWTGATLNWQLGTAPTLSTAASSIDIVTLVSLDGSTWEATYVLASATAGSFTSITATGVAHLNGGTDTSAEATASAPTFVSGTALQLSTTTDVMLYINVTTAAALEVQFGPTTGAETTLVASETVALGLLAVRVPKGWHVKITGTIADLAITQVTC